MAHWMTVVLCTVLVAWDANGQAIVVQPVDAKGTEGVTSYLNMDVEVSNLNQVTQVMAIRRESAVIIDGLIKREDAFTSLGLDSDKYSVSETINSDTTTIEYRLELSNPTRVDSAEFTFIVCRRLTPGGCNVNAVQLASNTASFTVNYVPGVAYPNCTSDGPQLPMGSLGDGDGERVTLGTPTVLSCLSEIGQPPVQLTWEKNGTGVSTENENAGVYRYGKHTFTPSLGDEGEVFVCNMTPGLTGPDYLSRTCVLGINVVSTPAVEITYEDTKGYIIVGSTVVFTCSATTETSTVNATTWTVPEELQNTTDRYEINDEQFTFTLKQVELVDNGVNLTCMVIDNEGMEGSRAVTLQVIDAADLPTDPVTVPTAPAIIPTPTTTKQPEDYTAIIIGSLFGGLLLILLVGMVILFYWRKKAEKKPKPVDHPSHNAKQTAKPPSTGLSSKNYESKTTVTRQHGATVNEEQLSHDQDVLGYNDPDVVPRGSRLNSPVRGDSLEKQRAAPSRTLYENVPLKDRHPATTHDKYRYDTDYDRPGYNYDDGVFIDSGYPEKGSHHDAETGEDRYPDHHRYDDDSDRPPSDVASYNYDNRGYDGKYEDEHSRDGRYDDRYGDYNDKSWPSDADHKHTYDDRAYDDRAYDQEPYSRDDGSYEDGYRRDSYDKQYDDRYRDYGKPDYDQNDRGGDPYRPSNDDEGSYGRRTPSDYSEQESYSGSYEPTADRYDNNSGMYTLQHDDYDDNPSYV
ncbi:uncharacterized protein LOC119738253 [Patiria miniata]|uniref:Ig-like domain-containing protein n=1 Tax=Patiria miniata TaxID=46514 RepID=A0A914AZN3_PATMI|nr:uncharacterized protein LOC119738253 [Patiria miniata]